MSAAARYQSVRYSKRERYRVSATYLHCRLFLLFSLFLSWAGVLKPMYHGNFARERERERESERRERTEGGIVRGRVGEVE